MGGACKAPIRGFAPPLRKPLQSLREQQALRAEDRAAPSRRGTGILPVSSHGQDGYATRVAAGQGGGPGSSRVPTQSPSRSCDWGQSSSREVRFVAQVRFNYAGMSV